MLIYLTEGRRQYGDRPVPPIRRSAWEFQAVVRGRCAPLLTGRQLSLQRRTLWLFAPDYVHGWRGQPGESCSVVVFHFDRVPAILREIVGEAGWLSLSLKREGIDSIEQLGWQLSDGYRRGDAIDVLEQERAAIDLALFVLRQMNLPVTLGPPQLAARRVEAGLAWYADHMAARPTVEEVAGAVGVSAPHLRRLFHRSRGMSPLQAMREIQLQRVCELLSHSDMSLSAIAEVCGFSAQSVLSRTFRQSFKVSPSQWRLSVRPSPAAD
jgi:AraC family transcriptional regulator